MTPHKHANLIKLWADGATIQFRTGYSDQWLDCFDNDPHWTMEWQFRVKPS